MASSSLDQRYEERCGTVKNCQTKFSFNKIINLLHLSIWYNRSIFVKVNTISSGLNYWYLLCISSAKFYKFILSKYATCELPFFLKISYQLKNEFCNNCSIWQLWVFPLLIPKLKFGTQL